ncbi:SMI1/KNR4 family protein [Empedobacter falsenii]|uniref:SMI1/KNR4 family protein n=1 Tax=Empedobacter falsenii TaxID=343874 RepID=UPI00257773A7|nr:SMI1/KNR4 family protein [Empedobacter falsenii]MDM1298313.1 SMI1/KNR4 family protein [Empedobacter falsenii]MDM1318130.1 SMI1/KNR4 family protein [Empedobacter falsenii]
MKLPQHWRTFIEAFQEKFDTEIVYDIVCVFQDKEAIEERYTTYEFEEYLPNYIPIADDSGGQVAVISIHENDNKVYLTSYGTLIEADFKMLDRNLLHWMERKFPFGSVDDDQVQQSDEQLHFYQQENEKLQSKINLFPTLVNFLKNNLVIENLCLPENYPSLENIFDFQDGYAYNSVNNTFLYGQREGDFKDSWLVIATNYFADPFFIDFDESSQNFPVYFAYHAAGKWSPIRIADSIEAFQQKLKEIHEYRFQKEELIKIINIDGNSTNEFWNEVFESCQNLSEINENDLAQKYEQSDWREAELYITDIGPNKMKIVSKLKEKFNLSGTEALQLSKQDRILYHKGTYRWMAPSIQQLEKLGATVEIVMI